MDVFGTGFVGSSILLVFLLSVYFGVCESQDERSVRIVDGPSPREGRVEIFLNEEWGTVSQDGWTDREAAVVCRQLGFHGQAVTKDAGSADLAIDVPVLSVDCSDGDSSLTDCTIIKTDGSTMMDASLDYLQNEMYWNHDANAGVECRIAKTRNVVIIINVIAVLVVIGLICFCGCLFHRLIKNRSVAKKRQAEQVRPEAVAMYSTRVEKDYTDYAEGRGPQYSSVKYHRVDQENAYLQIEEEDNALLA